MSKNPATPPRLSPALRSLCARLASERNRPATWAAAADLRKQVLQRLQSGEDAEALAAELSTAIDVCAAGARAKGWGAAAASTPTDPRNHGVPHSRGMPPV